MRPVRVGLGPLDWTNDLNSRSRRAWSVHENARPDRGGRRAREGWSSGRRHLRRDELHPAEEHDLGRFRGRPVDAAAALALARGRIVEVTGHDVLAFDRSALVEQARRGLTANGELGLTLPQHAVAVELDPVRARRETVDVADVAEQRPGDLELVGAVAVQRLLIRLVEEMLDRDADRVTAVEVVLDPRLSLAAAGGDPAERQTCVAAVRIDLV